MTCKFFQFYSKFIRYIQVILKCCKRAFEFGTALEYFKACKMNTGDTDVLLVIVAHLYEYKKRIYITDSHGQYEKNIRLSITFEDEIINQITL